MGRGREAAGPSLHTASLVIDPLSSKHIYLDRYARPDKGWTDRDESQWPVPFWHIDTGMATLLILLTAVHEGLGACHFGIVPEAVDQGQGDVRTRSAGLLGWRGVFADGEQPGFEGASPVRPPGMMTCQGGAGRLDP